jgi:hypothetical protein
VTHIFRREHDEYEDDEIDPIHQVLP